MLYFRPDSGRGDACPADEICIFKELRMAFGRRRGPSLETGTLQPWPIRSSLSSMVGGGVCDEKGQGSDCGSEDARGIPRLEPRDVGHPATLFSRSTVFCQLS